MTRPVFKATFSTNQETVFSSIDQSEHSIFCAVSAPVASSQAGLGGIAIAGGHAIAIAGVDNPETFLGTIGAHGDTHGDAQRPGWEALRRSSNNRQQQQQQQPMQIFPTIHNYFFNVPQSLFRHQTVNNDAYRNSFYKSNFYSFR